MTTTSTIPPDQKRKWYSLALRHLRMASRLLDSGFADGATFHIYHAYECVLSAFIAAHGYPVPPEGWTALTSPTGKIIRAYPSPGGGIQDKSAHKARLMFFIDLADVTKLYYTHHRTLGRYLTLGVRMDALYYDANADRLPHEVYNRSFAFDLLPEVHLFAQKVWKEIH